MAKRPNKVKVGPFTYSLTVYKELMNAKREDLWGQCDSHNMSIRLLDGLPSDREANTYLHECLHAMFHTACPHMEEEERIVTQLAPVLMKFIKDNPKFMEYIKNA
jgi:hypothetical protein